jgi:uncharacterized protein YacL
MRTQDLILVITSVICLMIFTLFLFDYYLRTEETKVIQKNVYYDSLLLEEQKMLKEKDSIILEDEHIINSRLNNHEYRIKKLEKTDK